jgi:hypothetical protein
MSTSTGPRRYSPATIIDPEVEERQAALTQRIKDCDRRLERYRTAIDHAGGEIGSITKWIAEVEHERRSLQSKLGRVVPLPTARSQPRLLTRQPSGGRGTTT